MNKTNGDYLDGTFNKHNKLGGSPGLVVMGDNSCRGFESRCHILNEDLDTVYIDLL